jgi:hypothetical protein
VLAAPKSKQEEIVREHKDHDCREEGASARSKQFDRRQIMIKSARYR